MPAWTSLSPRAVPVDLTRFRCLPEYKILLVLFAGIHFDTDAETQLLQILAR
ncbi:hypothetical protein D3C73_1553170 [compost metagenome]